MTLLCEHGQRNDWDQVLLQLAQLQKEPTQASLDQALREKDGVRSWTVLHHAAFDNQAAVVRQLLAAGADPLITCGRGGGALASAVGVSAYFASPDALKVFIEMGVDIYLRPPHLVRYQQGSTLLHRIMSQKPRNGGTHNDQMGIIHLLVNVYDNPFCVDEEGFTPEDLANLPSKAHCFREAWSLRERQELQAQLDLGPLSTPKSRRRM